jgi:hypothetical protein
MRPLPRTADLLRLAPRVLWFEPAEQALADPVRFLAYVMTYATCEEIEVSGGTWNWMTFARRSSTRRQASWMTGLGRTGML